MKDHLTKTIRLSDSLIKSETKVGSPQTHKISVLNRLSKLNVPISLKMSQNAIPAITEEDENFDYEDDQHGRFKSYNENIEGQDQESEKVSEEEKNSSLKQYRDQLDTPDFNFGS